MQICTQFGTIDCAATVAEQYDALYGAIAVAYHPSYTSVCGRLLACMPAISLLSSFLKS